MKADLSWSEVVSANSEDGDFCRIKACQTWVAQLSEFVRSTLGKNPKIRLFSYISGRSTYLAIDLFAPKTADSISITVLLRGKGFYLAGPRDRQIDIELAGLVDSFDLIGKIASPSSTLLTGLPLWLSAQGTPIA